MEAPGGTPVYFDCDTGVDDAVALAYLLVSPEVDLVGVGTVSGNVDAARAARNTLDLLALGGRSEVAVAVGAHDPLVGEFHGGAAMIHGADGTGDVELPRADAEPVQGTAADLLLRLSHEHAGSLRVLAVGPLTNLALALRADPTLVSRVADVTIMGGAALCQGNITPVAEANIANDAEAARIVLEAPWPVTLVPLDVTLDHTLEEADRAVLLASPAPLTAALGRVLDLYFEFYVATYGRRCCSLHDPLAAAVAVGVVQPANAPVVYVEVDDTDGPGRGQTICDLRGRFLGYPEQPGAHVRVVLSVDQPLAPHLLSRLVGAD